MTVLSILGTVLAISLLIIVHEAGHYFVAKWCKMRVDRFSLGFGPGLVTWRRNETEFQLAPVPFGGFVEIRGMNVAEDIDPNDQFAYPNRPVWQRIATIFAGPGTNYLFAIALAFVLFASAGVPTGTDWYVVDSVSADLPADGVLQPGDRIVAIQRPDEAEPRWIYARYNGAPQPRIQDVINEAGPVELRVTVDRAGSEQTFTIRPTLYDPEEDNVKPGYILGVRLRYKEERVDVGLVRSLGYALSYPVIETKRIVNMLRQIAKREVKGELTGVIGIGDAIKTAIETSWIQTLQLLMVLNVMLGLFNLFPIPALDGGRLVFLIYELATRRRPNPKIEATVHMVGILFLLILMVVVTYKDCQRVFFGG